MFSRPRISASSKKKKTETIAGDIQTAQHQSTSESNERKRIEEMKGRPEDGRNLYCRHAVCPSVPMK
jgi:hypothetical protein